MQPAQDEQEKIVYLTSPKKTRKIRHLKYMNILMACLAIYFVFTIANQEVRLYRLRKEEQALSTQHEELKQKEKDLHFEIADAGSEENIKTKAKEYLGWVEEGETKLVEKQ